MILLSKRVKIRQASCLARAFSRGKCWLGVTRLNGRCGFLDAPACPETCKTGKMGYACLRVRKAAAWTLVDTRDIPPRTVRKEVPQLGEPHARYSSNLSEVLVWVNPGRGLSCSSEREVRGPDSCPLPLPCARSRAIPLQAQRTGSFSRGKTGAERFHCGGVLIELARSCGVLQDLVLFFEGQSPRSEADFARNTFQRWNPHPSPFSINAPFRTPSKLAGAWPPTMSAKGSV